MIACSDEVIVGVEVRVVIAASISNHSVHVHAIAQKSSYATEAFHELEAVGRLVSDELDLDAVFFEVKADPVGQRLATDYLKVNTGLGVLKVLGVLLLRGVEQVNLRLVLDGIFNLVSHHFNVFEEHHCLQSSEIQRLHGIVYSEHDQTRVQGNVFEEFANNSFFLNELHV